MEELFVNKVANSGLITLNLEDYFPQGERVFIDIKEVLFMGMVLKEKDFRDWVKTHDWTVYQSKNVAIGCTADAIIPTWAYMLMASKLSGIAREIVFGDLTALEAVLWRNAIANIDAEPFRDQKMVIKGCGDLPVTAAAYSEITRVLTPIAKSIMYGEPCSTVPVYKSKQ
jgi:alanine dehydrogenase